MKILIITVRNTTQAKLIIKHGFAIIKIPGNISYEQQVMTRKALVKIADANRDTRQYLKLYYKIGTPYLFLNRKISSHKRETFAVYAYKDLI